MIDELYYDAIDMLKGMIAIPSVSREEKEVADYIGQLLSSFGLKVNRHGNNLWCTAPEFDTSKPTLLLNSHIDTVKPAQGWTFEPFNPIEENDRIYGLGSNDAGASVVALTAAFRHLCTIDRAYNLILLLSCEEEVSGKNGIESILPLLPEINVAIVGEPTGMQPAIAEKGLMVLDGEITGVSGHAARAEGINAIYRATEVIETLKNMKFEKESALLGPIKITITQIQAGTQHNVIPDMCRIVADVRTTDAYSNEETLSLIWQSIPLDWCKLTPRSVRLNPSGIDASHPIVQRLITLGCRPFGSPTLSDQALMPFPSLKLGPGDSARSHTADEYIRTCEIRSAIHTYISLLTTLRI
ncbi:MAG: M20 family metallo-hydrolase [Muribaculaceae bacterium]|nr:M20 family metallo-hydrolase [Muribaculaceae bacterium]